MSFGVAGSKFTSSVIHASTDGYEKGHRTVHICTIATIDNRVYRGTFDYRGIYLSHVSRFNLSFLSPSRQIKPIGSLGFYGSSTRTLNNAVKRGKGRRGRPTNIKRAL